MTTLALDSGTRVGIALLDDAGQLIVCRTMDWYKQHFKLVETLRGFCEHLKPNVFIEMPRKGSMRRRSRSLGHCEVKAMTLAAICESFGAKVELVHPIRGLTKLSPKKFAAMFPEWRGKQTSNHARDAATLAKVCHKGGRR